MSNTPATVPAVPAVPAGSHRGRRLLVLVVAGILVIGLTLVTGTLGLLVSGQRGRRCLGRRLPQRGANVPWCYSAWETA